MTATKNLSEKIQLLEQKTEWFYSDDFGLEDAAKNFKAATTLAKEIDADLDNLKNEIEILAEDFSK